MERGISFGRLPLAALAAVGLAATGNALVYYLALLTGLIPAGYLVPGPGGEIPLNALTVVVSSAMGVVGAAVVFVVIGWFSVRPARPFRILAAVILVLSFATPFAIPGAPLTTVLALETMHILAWAVCVGPMVAMSSNPVGTESGQI